MKKSTTIIFTIALALAFVAAPYSIMACDGNSGTAMKTASVSDKSCSSSGVKTAAVSDKSCSAYGKTDDNMKGMNMSANATSNKAEVKYATATFNVKGMTCGGCENMVKTALQNHNGVASVDNISYKSGTCMVTYDPSAVSCPTKLAAVITDAGYEAEVAPGCDMEKAADKADDLKKSMTNAGNSSL